jgi:hypothetical protein
MSALVALQILIEYLALEKLVQRWAGILPALALEMDCSCWDGLFLFEQLTLTQLPSSCHQVYFCFPNKSLFTTFRKKKKVNQIMDPLEKDIKVYITKKFRWNIKNLTSNIQTSGIIPQSVIFIETVQMWPTNIDLCSVPNSLHLFQVWQSLLFNTSVNNLLLGAGGVAQVVEQLLRKHKALSLDPSPSKKLLLKLIEY